MAQYTKTLIRIPQIARMRVAGIADKKIAETYSMSYQALAQLLMTQEYKDEEQAVLHGQISKIDEAMAGNIDIIKKTARLGVPVALQCLLDSAMQRKDLKAAILASKELLDRDPDQSLAKQPEAQAPQVPAGVLKSAIDIGNKVAQSYDKAKVN
jgi:hypothetical protein